MGATASLADIDQFSEAEAPSLTHINIPRQSVPFLLEEFMEMTGVILYIHTLLTFITNNRETISLHVEFWRTS